MHPLCYARTIRGRCRCTARPPILHVTCASLAMVTTPPAHHGRQAAPAVPAPSCVKPTAQPQSMLMQQSATLSSMSALAPASTHFPDGMLLVALVLVIAVLTLTVRAWMRGRRHERRCLPHRHAALVRTTSELSGENDFMECDGYVAFDALRPPAVPQNARRCLGHPSAVGREVHARYARQKVTWDRSSFSYESRMESRQSSLR